MVAVEDKLPVILLAGPTGVGKTALSLKLAAALGTEIINADSMQVYRYMDIGTAKPTPAERKLAVHHLLDLVNPDESFDAARYLDFARPVVDRLHGMGKIPLIVGGTGLYMKVLTRGICAGAPGDPDVREQLLREEKDRGLVELHAELLKVDTVLGRLLHPNDRQRIIRALEVWRITGKPLSDWQSMHKFRQTLYRSIKIFLYREREEIYERINRRVTAMIEQGFVDEVRQLIARGYGPELNSMQSLGYRQLMKHLLDGYHLDKAIENIQRETRRYAKRQMTWFRGDTEFQWFDAKDPERILTHVLGAVAETRPHQT
ncbi:MAG: tRNA (adenosine(37)-N6)-dimethylallyltransferase MiaA [Syntrophobacteraceae bacterium]